MSSNATPRAGDDEARPRRVPVTAMLLPLLLSVIAPASLLAPVGAQDDDPGYAPEDLWSDEYASQTFPWGNPQDERVQFRMYHDYFTMKDRMQFLADRNPDIISFHEGLIGGINSRGNEMGSDDYEGWYYNHASPWVKITADVTGGDCNDFVGDCGNYADRPDVMFVGNHHAREWMSYTVPMLFIETVVYYYGQAGVDNDGDGLIDEDGWDGIDNDGDCWMLNASLQDYNGDGVACGPGDLGVDEDFSEQFITDLVNSREIYVIPMLNVDGNRYDREEYCGETAWENCRTSGWRKNLRDNTVTGVTPLPDIDEEVDEGCDGGEAATQGVESARGQHAGGDRGHRGDRGGAREAAVDDAELADQLAGAEDGDEVLADGDGELAQLIFARQLAVQEQMHNLKEAALLGKLLDRVAPVLEDSLVPIDVGDRALAGGGIGKSGVIGHEPEVILGGLDLPEHDGGQGAIHQVNIVRFTSAMISDRYRFFRHSGAA